MGVVVSFQQSAVRDASSLEDRESLSYSGPSFGAVGNKPKEILRSRNDNLRTSCSIFNSYLCTVLLLLVLSW